MNKFAIIYASVSGNTEEIAELIADGIRASGAEVDLKTVENSHAEQLLQYKGYLLGAYTWGDGELPDEFLDFCDEMDEVDLQGSRAAVFGSGDSGYDIYCGAVDQLEEKLRTCGAMLLQESLKIEYGPNKDEKVLCREFGKSFAEACMSVLNDHENTA
ncbi:flavodoxin [Paenibacillus sp. FA6]|uniref:flavodoxin n=1 Tax=Paenibacillus sp. FA6 TaxID=3413029 RepID=UPI003F659DC1